jgi:putative ABC transport system permease protein
MVRLFNRFRRRRDRLAHDLDRELRYHVDRRVAEMMMDGLDEREARRRANLEIGGVTQVREAVQDTWTWAWLDAIALDARYAIRSLTRSRGFTLGTGAVLALAVGTNVALFSFVNAVLLRPLPYPDAERLVSVETLWTNTGRVSQDVSGPDFLDWRAQSDVFEMMAVTYGEDDVATVVGERAVFANDRYVSGDFFTVFGQSAFAGRLLTVQDEPAGERDPTIAVVAHHWARAHFGSAEAAIGQIITVYGNALEIVGVAAPGFRFPGAADIWAPWRTENGGTNRSLHNYRAVGKLKAGVELTRAQAQMRTIGDSLAHRYSENRNKTVALIPLRERVTGHLQATLWALMTAAGVVLLMACANTANLLLTRTASRTREIALRSALGAGRGRVARQLMTESCVLAAAATLTGLVIASFLMQGILALSPVSFAGLDLRMDAPVLLFAVGLASVAALVLGLLPALQASRLDLMTAAGGSKRTASTDGSARLRSTLVVTEVALSVILLVSAALLLRSLQLLQQVDLGFATDRVLVAYTQYAVRDGNEADIRRRMAFYAGVLDRLRAVPGVTAAAGVATLPMGRQGRSASRDVFIQGRPEGQPGDRPTTEVYAITPDYFRTLDIPIRSGRDFDRTDTMDRPPVAIINEALARAVFPGEAPLGRYIRWNTRGRWMEIVGVVADIRWQHPSQAPRPALYASSWQGWGTSPSILARTSLDEQSLAGTLRAVLHEANPSVPVRFETMDELFASALAYPRFRTQVIGVFAAAAALLAAVGIFSVLAYLVSQRTREIAIRRAVGARAADVVRLIVGQGLRLTALGLVLGLAGAVVLARLLEGLLYQVSPWDAVTYLGAVGVLSVAAMLAILLPALRAATIAPVIVLQQE